MEVEYEALKGADGLVVRFHQNPAEKQALKYFDELLTAAQEVVNDAEPIYTKTGAGGSCVAVEEALVNSLKAIVQKISDDAVRIIEEASGGGNLAVMPREERG